MIDLDQMKKAWKEQPTHPKYSSDEIVKLLNKRSKNNVKYILWIILLEFLFVTGFHLLNISEEDSAKQLLKLLHRLDIKNIETFQHRFDTLSLVMKTISIGILGYYAWAVFKRYNAIKVQCNTRLFIQQIIEFRKTAKHFIWVNIALAFAFIVSFYFLMFSEIQAEGNSFLKCKNFIIVCLLSMGGTLLVIWAYYQIAYGTFLRRLNKYLKQLKETEEK